jgi:ketosteroid isomerase-like protein
MHAFRTAVEAQDLEAMTACMAEDAELHSPVAFRPFAGREAVAGVFAQLLRTFEDFRYTDELRQEDGTLTLIFRARVGDRSLEGVDLIRFDDDGLIAELTVFVRPLSAIMALGEAMAPAVTDLNKAGSGAGHA